jgi:hypothetical protein
VRALDEQRRALGLSKEELARRAGMRPEVVRRLLGRPERSECRGEATPRKGPLRLGHALVRQAAAVEAASTACIPRPAWVTSTLWGLACSTTGMVTVSTPSS